MPCGNGRHYKSFPQTFSRKVVLYINHHNRNASGSGRKGDDHVQVCVCAFVCLCMTLLEMGKQLTDDYDVE